MKNGHFCAGRGCLEYQQHKLVATTFSQHYADPSAQPTNEFPRQLQAQLLPSSN